MTPHPRPTIHAPEFPEGMEWFNTPHPLRLADLRGRVVLLDFWTYCWINCLHVLPELEALEARFPRTLTIIGVHSAKFPNEREAVALRHAIRRHQITHPVVNDAEFVIWQCYGVRAWPTLVLIDPAGYVVGAVAGEGHGAALQKLIEELIAEHRAAGTLREGPGPVATPEGGDGGILSFPGKVALDSASGGLAIADSGHHRILLADLDGTIRAVAGTGKPGADKGMRPQFFEPGGLAAASGYLYIADTNNHRICVADLATRSAATLPPPRPSIFPQRNPLTLAANPC